MLETTRGGPLDTRFREYDNLRRCIAPETRQATSRCCREGLVERPSKLSSVILAKASIQWATTRGLGFDKMWGALEIDALFPNQFADFLFP